MGLEVVKSVFLSSYKELPRAFYFVFLMIICFFLVKKWKTSAVSTTDWIVETQLCKRRGTSDTFVGRAYSIFHWIKKVYNLFFLSRSHTISNIHLTGRKTYPTENAITREQYVSRLCSLRGKLTFTHFFLGRLTNQFDAFFNPKNVQRRKLILGVQINNKCSKQIWIEVLSRIAVRTSMRWWP